MTVEVVSYEYGSANSPYVGRISLQLFRDERFVASYQHGGKKSEWQGRLVAGTFSRACEVLANAGFPNVPPLTELAPGESPLELGWLSDGSWQRSKSRESGHPFVKIEILASTILSVLDSNLARMPPGETTPIIEHQRVL